MEIEEELQIENENFLSPFSASNEPHILHFDSENHREFYRPNQDIKREEEKFSQRNSALFLEENDEITQFPKAFRESGSSEIFPNQGNHTNGEFSLEKGPGHAQFGMNIANFNPFQQGRTSQNSNSSKKEGIATNDARFCSEAEVVRGSAGVPHNDNGSMNKFQSFLLQMSQEAKKRWLKVDEILKLLALAELPECMGLKVNQLPHRPSPGFFCVVQITRAESRKWKKDGYQYEMRKNGSGYKESSEVLRHSGKQVNPFGPL